MNDELEDLKGRGMRYYPVIFWDIPRKTMKLLSQGGLCPFPKYKSRVLSLE
jgi:hypothetical protein